MRLNNTGYGLITKDCLPDEMKRASENKKVCFEIKVKSSVDEKA